MKNERITFFFILLSFLFRPDISHGQSEDIDFQTWSDFTYTYFIKNQTKIGADIGFRGIVSKNNWNQFYFRPTYKYYFNRTLQAAGGVAIFVTSSEVINNTTEFRIFQQMNVAWPIVDYIGFYHRLRFEERFFAYQENDQFSTDLPNDFEARARYQLRLESADIRIGNKNRPIYFLAAWELFYSINEAAVESLINNQRILVGFGHRLSPSFRYEIQYIFQKSRRYSEDGFKTSEHLLRLRLFLLQRFASSVDD